MSREWWISFGFLVVVGVVLWFGLVRPAQNCDGTLVRGVIGYTCVEDGRR